MPGNPYRYERGQNMKLRSIQSAILSQFPACRCTMGDAELEIDAVLLGGGQPEMHHAVRLYSGPVPWDAPGTGAQECCLCLAQHAPQAVNSILAPDRETLEAVFNRIQIYLAKAQALAQLTQQAVMGRLDLQQVVSRATGILENPLLVADPSYRILAISDVELDDSAWKHFQELRRIPYHPDMVQKQEQFFHEMRRGERISVVDGKHKKGYFIRCAVMHGDIYMAQMHIFSYFHEFSAVDMELAAMLAGAVSVAILQNAPEQDGNSTSSDYLISDLILGKLTDREIVQSRLDYVGWTLKPIKYLLLVYWDGDEKSVNFRDACIRSLCRIFPDGRCAADGPYMVVMFSTERELTVHSPELEQVLRQVERTNQRGVLSLPFEEVTDAAYRYRQTRDILDLNRRLDPSSRFLQAEASSIELMIAQAGTKYRLMDYCHPLVRRLMEYDRSTGRDYIDTLRAYIETGRSYTKAAERLHMHRNSVIYRMRQIEEILEYDFTRDEFSFHLELSFRILDYMLRENGAGGSGV